MSAGIRPHRVAVLVLDDVVLGDLSAPVEVFGRAHHQGAPSYEVRLCGPTRQVRSRYVRLDVPWALATLRWAQTIIVPGLESLQPVRNDVLRALIKAHARGARIASICSGAFVLAQTGLLDGRRATTHWQAADALQRHFPRITVDPSVLYVDAGQVLTSAGAAAGLDLCLHLVRRDFGAALAAQVARASVMPLERAGGQAQFIVPSTPEDPGSLAPLLAWLDRNLEHPLTASIVARRAGLSVRSLHRHFQAQVGLTPARYVARQRVLRAQHLLETTRLDIERIAERTGFASASVLRAHFSQQTGTSPLAWRRSFRRER